MAKEVFPDEASFQEAWLRGSPVSGRVGVPAFFEAAEKVGTAMADHGFRLFRNGGLPLLERRVDALREEIVMSPAPRSVPGVYEPMLVKVHISHEGLKEVRARYWVGSPPGTVASGHLGRVADPPSWVLWEVSDGWPTAKELAEWVSSLAVGWFDRFDSLETLAGSLLIMEVPLLSTAAVLELLIADRGRDRAKRYLREIIEFGATLSARNAPLSRVDLASSTVARLDAIATTYRLR